MKNTFGKSLSAERLEELLENNPSARRKVSTLLSTYTNHLLLVTQAKNPSTVRLCMDLLRDYTLNRVDIKVNLSPDIRTYTKNVIIARYRAFRHGFDTVSKMMKRLEDDNTP